ncbi:DUF317 domain-containing protein [Streptomyces sp. NBC_00690]|uniref:DUF317 domain-containing protein n=1 Tax=Streptomyces sp. NBC_00690 TaxID=2975808 RepID=UPI002E2A6702|nr:DUF317 domain-containing protein [Streptomyces sp. NBC_00690]
MLRREQLDLFASEHTGFLSDVSPRYLAGPGDARHTTHALAAAGWKVRSDPLAPVVDLVSPDRLHRLRHEPQTTADDAAWYLRSEGPFEHWYAQFTAIPVEILAGLTDRLLPSPAVEPPGVWELLADAGWSRTPRGDAAHSPDSMVSTEHLQIVRDDPARAWRITVRPDAGEGPLIWSAWIAHEPPPHLVSGLIAALTDTAPVQRDWSQTEAHYSALRTESRMTPEAYVAAHRTRLDTVGARVRATRRNASPSESTPPLKSAPLRQAR